MMPTTLVHEYRKFREHFNWSAHDYLAANLSAVEHAFLNADRKDELRSTLRQAYESVSAQSPL